jgi:hypothetical protein
MFLRAEQTDNARGLPILFYMYTPGLREALLAQRIHVPPISFPEYMPSGEIRVKNPDGSHIAIGRWAEAEHPAWLARIGAAKQGNERCCGVYSGGESTGYGNDSGGARPETSRSR